MDTATPTSSSKATPRDVFLQLLSLSMLYVSAVSLIALLFQYVNYLVPDALAYEYYGISGGLRGSLATLVVVFPVYVALAWYFQKEGMVDATRREIKIRKWLVYLTLFVSAITVIVDLVILVNKYLGGELSLRFGLKILAVLLVAAGVFGYYLWDLKRPSGPIAKQVKNILIGAVVVVAGVIVGGFFLAGSPQKQRMVRFDQQRISDLNILQQQAIDYWQQKSRLPANLDELKNDISGFRPPQDPETKASYEYAVKSDLSFDLCANFATESRDEKTARSMPYYDPYAQNWEHGKGRVCFTRTIDPELYKNRDMGFPVKPIPTPALDVIE